MTLISLKHHFFLFDSCFAFQPGSHSTPQAGPALTVWRRLALNLQESFCLTACSSGFIHRLLPMLFYFYFFTIMFFYRLFPGAYNIYIMLEFLFPLSCVLWLGAHPLHSCHGILCSACTLIQTHSGLLSPPLCQTGDTHADHSRQEFGLHL